MCSQYHTFWPWNKISPNYPNYLGQWWSRPKMTQAFMPTSSFTKDDLPELGTPSTATCPLRSICWMSMACISVSTSVDRCQLKMCLHLFQLAWGSSSTGSMAPSSTYKMHQKAIKHYHYESKYLQNTCKALARNQWSRILLVPAPCLTRLTF